MKKNALICALSLVCLLVFAFSPAASFASDTPPLFWTTKYPIPSARGQASVVNGDNGLIYVMGGSSGGDAVNNVYAYDPLRDIWSFKSPMPQITRGAAAAKGPNGIIYVISGYNDSVTYGYPAAVQAYNTTSNTWTVRTNIPVPSWLAAAATGNDGRIYVFGGESYGLLDGCNLTQIYNPETGIWTNGTDMPTLRKGHAAVKAADGLIYVMGGYNETLALSVVEAYNPATNTWHTKAPMPIPKTEFCAVLGPDNKIYVIGGGANTWNNNPPFYDSVEVYDPKTDSWSQLAWSESLLPTARKEAGAALGANGKIYVVGGSNGVYLSVNEEATIVPPENLPPTAYVDSIAPNPATTGEPTVFVGHGSDPDGYVAAYKWRSSLNGTIGTEATLNLTKLVEGTHNIFFSVKDDSGMWSLEVSATVVVKAPITEDPLYQKIQDTNDALNSRINDLAQQNTNLTNTANDLSKKVDTLTTLLAGASVVIMVLVVITIVLVFIGKRKPKAAPT